MKELTRVKNKREPHPRLKNNETKLIKTKVADVTSKVVCGGKGCTGWMTNTVVIGGERYKYESTSGGVRVNSFMETYF